MAQINRKQIARTIVESLSGNYAAIEPHLTDDFIVWSSQGGEMKKETLRNILATMQEHMATPMVVEALGFIEEGDQVAVEARSTGSLKNGRKYNNYYHFLLIFRDSKVAVLKEYMDTKHAAEVWAGIFF
jgi:ketosteroid isomerase-like protein